MTNAVKESVESYPSETRGIINKLRIQPKSAMPSTQEKQLIVTPHKPSQAFTSDTRV